ncbi:MAG TPA: ABC transporter permease [Solirubrobacterales bacterium]
MNSQLEETKGTPSPAEPARQLAPSGREKAEKLLADYAVVLFLLVLIVGFSIALPSLFPTGANAKAILSDNAVPGILALAVILPLSAGEFDLSVGAVLGFTSVLAAWLTIHGVPLALAVPLTLLAGVLIGAINAFLVVKVKVSAFIATLGVATILEGGNLLFTNGSILFEGVAPGLLTFSRTHLLFGLPAMVFYFFAAALLLWYALEQTPIGRFLQATGLGRTSARLSGVRTDRYLAMAFIAAGLVAAFAGLVQTGRTGSASPTVGHEFLLPAYAAAFLGATTIRRGRFNVWGTVTGVFVLAVGVSGLALLGAPFWVGPVFNGCALIIAVSFAVVVGNRGKEQGANI